MKIADSKNLRIFTGNANPELAREIAEYMGVPLGSAYVGHFNNGETQVMIDESVRGKDVFIIQPTCQPVNDSMMELLIMIDACKRASAKMITAVVPYYAPYSPMIPKITNYAETHFLQLKKFVLFPHYH